MGLGVSTVCFLYSLKAITLYERSFILLSSGISFNFVLKLKGMYVLIGPKQRISPKREISTYFSLIKSQKIINATFKNRKTGNINPRHERFG